LGLDTERANFAGHPSPAILRRRSISAELGSLSINDPVRIDPEGR
jgi:hypothetical protein